MVIDEIDAFESQEYAFKQFAKAILTTKSNTIIIGIANSVDLPFKKKHSAIAMRDEQLLFEPYSEEQIISIIEQKTNMRYPKFPMKIKENREVKNIFFNLLEERGMDLVAKKVSKMNGDARVAFDIIKTSFSELYSRVKYYSEEDKEAMPPDDEIRVTIDLVVKVFKMKYGSKLPETLKCLPRQNLIILEAIVNLYLDSPSGEDRKITYSELQAEVEALCRERCLFDVIRLGSGIANFMDDLSFYNIIEIEKPKGHDVRRDVKQSKFWLKVEFRELSEELDKILSQLKEKEA